MKRDVATFVARCLICQQVQIKHQRASGLLQQLDIPIWKWDEISMDFFMGLPPTRRRPDAIWEAQKEDSKIWTIVKNLDKQVEFHLDEDNVLWQGTRLVVPNDATLREALLTEAHSSLFSVHPARCLICQQVKIEHQWASGLLQQLDIPVWKWDEISMEFVTGLPRTQRRHDAVWVVVDRLTKSAHFLPIRKDYSVSMLAEIFQQEIVRLHGTPSAIVSDRDPRFASRFWKGLQKAWGTRLKFNTAFHPQTDGQKFQPGDHVFLKVSPARGVRRFGIKGKLSPRFIRPFEILDRVGEVSYRLALPP
nr:retrotransposon protein, putative, Ty3-gypsy subclass [Tanacetum cinerariifolium]